MVFRISFIGIVSGQLIYDMHLISTAALDNHHNDIEISIFAYSFMCNGITKNTSKNYSTIKVKLFDPTFDIWLKLTLEYLHLPFVSKIRMDSLYDFHILFIALFISIREHSHPISMLFVCYNVSIISICFFLSSALLFSISNLYRINHFDFDSYFHILNIDNDNKNKRTHK